ncbi:sodium-independent sulfate anion transporter-like [Amphibalanus amphitrite]|uniref:sodium-independent sulfate anion transporter-like n=1 Tax=Amphibalanus amphitrite TaxID=1232801 RepID=UPI001C926238|nr:sodium-independent sulfate anion transporter-like [Amphibalanus amphitrite]
MSVQKWIKSVGARCAHGASIGRRLPIVSWLPAYSVSLLIRDLLAGVTVALMAVPQGIAYGQLAGLPPHFGLYACLLTGIWYAALGTTDVVSVGPTAVMSLLTAEFTGGDQQRAVLLAFSTGAVVTAAGCLRLGFLVDFFSVPVVSGFVSAASITICTTQLKGLFGLKGSSGKTITATLKHVFIHIKSTNLWDLLLGVSCIVVLLCLRMLGQRRPQHDQHSMKPSRRSRLLSGSLWMLSIARNGVVVLVTSVLVLVLESHQLHPFSTTETVAAGFPSPQLPPFYGLASNTTSPEVAGSAGNASVVADPTRWPGVAALASELGLGLVVVPLVATIECMAIAKAFAAHNRPQDHSQEMIALGVCNLLGALFSSYTVTGSFSRTALNHASGAATPIAGVVTCIFVMITLGSLTPYFRYIPTATLSAVIICAVFFMVDWKIVLDLWRCRKLDLIPLFVTLLAGLFWRLEYGILLGTGVSLLLLLHRAARPKVTLSYRLTPGGRPYLLVLPDCGLSYPAAEHVRQLIHEAAWAMSVTGKRPEVAAPLNGQSTAPSTDHLEDCNGKLKDERRNELGNGNDVRRTSIRNGGSSGITGNGVHETIPFVDDVAEENHPDDHETPALRSTNGSCGDAYHLILNSEDVVIKKDSSFCELVDRRNGEGYGATDREDAPLPVMLNCRNIRFTDFTAAKGLAAAAKSLQRDGGRPLVLLEIKPSVLAIWSGTDPAAFLVSQSEAAAAQLIDQWGVSPVSLELQDIATPGQNGADANGINGAAATPGPT